jgi:signal transduction histidine kinase
VIPARIRGVALVALVVGVIGWAVLDAVQAAGGRPLVTPWTAPAGIVILAGLVLVAGLEVRRWVAGRRERRLDPLLAARIAVLAKASAYAGGALAGWYLAQAVVVLPDLVGDRRARFVVSLLSALAAAVLAAAGLVAQRWCRRPDDENGRDGGVGPDVSDLPDDDRRGAA